MLKLYALSEGNAQEAGYSEPASVFRKSRLPRRQEL